MKKNNSFKLLALLLSLIMAVGCLAGCGSKETAPETAQTETEAAVEESTEEEEATAEVVPGELPLTTEDVTFTIGVMASPLTEDYENNTFTLWLEEQTGINLEFELFSSDKAEAANQLALMITSGEELPDILWDFNGLTIESSIEYGQDGYLINLDPYFDTLAHYYNIGVDLMTVEQEKSMLRSLNRDVENDAIYTFPSYQKSGDFMVSYTRINHEWLEAVGAEMPTNVDELYDVLVKFRDEDPNGNGKKDEIPMAGFNGYCAGLDQHIINAYVYCNDKYIWNITDGQLWTPYTTDEYREAMVYLNKLYSEGLFTDTMYTMSADSEYMALATPSDGVAITGVVAGHPSLIQEDQSPLVYDYTQVPVFSDETGKGGYASTFGANFYYNTAITSDCEDPELAFRLIDYMYSYDAVMNRRCGVEGTDWRRAEEGETTAEGKPAQSLELNPANWSGQNSVLWHSLGTIIAAPGFYDDVYFDDGSWNARVTSMCVEAKKAYNAAPWPTEMFTTVSYTSEENEVVSELQTIYKDYIKSSRALFVTGEKDPSNDADWEAYLAELEDLGQAELMGAAQAAYDRMK